MTPPGTHPRAAYWIEHLGLEVLEGESGWWTGRFRSAVEVSAAGGPSVACNAIYYLLEPSRPINAWHWLASDDTHVLIEGGPVEYVVATADGAVSRTIVDAGANPMISVPAGSYKALRLTAADGYALIGSVVAPAWTPDRVRVEPPALTERPTWLTDDLMGRLTTGV